MPFSFRRILAWRFLGRFCLPEGQSLARGAEATEPILHLVDFVADPLEHRLEPQAVGRETVQMVEDANEGMRRRRLAGVDLPADQVERRSSRAICRSVKSSAGLALRRSSCSRTICWTRRRLRFSEVEMARIDSPPIRRAKIRRARLCSSLKERTGFAAGEGMGQSFGERASIANILPIGKGLSKNLAGALGQNPIASYDWRARFGRIAGPTESA